MNTLHNGQGDTHQDVPADEQHDHENGGLNKTVATVVVVAAGAALFEHAKTIAGEIGFELVDTYTGGGSDGNFTAPNTATLDGLGVDGQGAHTHYEQLYISSLAPRARLLYRLYQTLL